MDSLANIRVSTRDGQGDLSVVEMLVPSAHMPPLHVHDEDETFVVVESRMTLFAGDQVIEAEAGDILVSPKGIPHTFRIESETARQLVVTSSPRFEDFLRAVSRPAERPALPPAADGPPSPEQAAAFTRAAAENGIEILGPPGMVPTDL